MKNRSRKIRKALPCHPSCPVASSKWCHQNDGIIHQNDGIKMMASKWCHQNDGIKMMASKWWHHFSEMMPSFWPKKRQWPPKCLKSIGFFTVPHLRNDAIIMMPSCIKMMAAKWCHRNDGIEMMSSKWWHRNDESAASKWWHRHDGIILV